MELSLREMLQGSVELTLLAASDKAISVAINGRPKVPSADGLLCEGTCPGVATTGAMM